LLNGVAIPPELKMHIPDEKIEKNRFLLRKKRERELLVLSEKETLVHTKALSGECERKSSEEFGMYK
jgi:hypothetical protein